MEIGARFGRWAVVGDAPPREFRNARSASPKVAAAFRCRCDCGVERDVIAGSLTSGRSTSCGCYQVESSVARHLKHGGTLGGKRTAEYSAWSAIIKRCYNQGNKRYKDYGGRGITVCDAWRHDYAAFLAAVGPRPSAEYSIDRMNNERGYEPGNCRWAIAHHQMTNRRNSQFIDVDGVRTPVSDVAKKYGIPANTLRWRILTGWSFDEATRTPVRPKKKSGITGEPILPDDD